MVTNEDQIKKLVSSETDPSLFLVRLSTMDSPRRPGSVIVPTLEEAVRIAMENRLELRQAAIDLQNSDIDVAYTKNQKLPILDATLAYTQNGTGGTRTIRDGFNGPVIQVIPGGIGSAYGQMFELQLSGIFTQRHNDHPAQKQGSQGGSRASSQ